MRFNVAGLLRAPTGEVRQVRVDSPINIHESLVRTAAPVTGHLTLIREPDGILAEGELGTRLSLSCSRCLVPFESALVFELSESFRPTVQLPGGPSVHVDDETDRATLIDDAHALDLTEVVRQAIVLGAPLNPLCGADCAGLCTECGLNLNESQCECEPEPDPRWQSLRVMLEED